MKTTALGCLGLAAAYILSLVVWVYYWERPCLRAGFLRAAITYRYEVFCQDGNKSLRIDPWTTATEKRVDGTEVK